MYLKSIEMQGFKSFANKIVLEFHDGITGIVGPNGSGKSNVGDAVRWVLGEQSAKQLRGGSMQDVIFSGTETRKPLGFASVAITLDNSDHKLNVDYEEVTVTRRLYRSGESEYLLNGRSCRLKDINELFYDTGIGKEGYSLIGQGQIDKILSGKPEERRELFDEAAGIVKFKRRKAATLKKLEEEQQNLVRVTDILAELTRQLKPLERQSEKARVYLKKREELKVLDMNLFLLESARTEQQIAETEEKKKRAEEELRTTEEAFARTKQEYEEIESNLSRLDEKIQELREQASGNALRKQQLEGQVRLLQEQISSSAKNREQFGQRIASLEEEIRRKEESVSGFQREREALEKERQAALEEKQTQEQALDRLRQEIGAREQEEEKARGEMIALLNQRSSTKGKIQRYDAMLEQIGIRRAELAGKLLSLKSGHSQEKEELASLEKQQKELDLQAAELEKKIGDNQSRIRGLQSRIDEKSRQLDIGQTTYHRESSRLESLKNITERYEGYGNSIRKIMERKDQNPGIHGVVADLIKTEKKYETAIETALGGSLQNIVTDNENTAKDLIEYLKRGHYGRATFLPLTSMNREQPKGNSAALREEGVLGAAADLVSCDAIYENLTAHLLGRTLVLDTIDHAIVIGRKYRHSLRMVTLEGELLSPGGSMTGGSFRNNSNLLGRRREIADLEESVGVLKKEMTAMQQEIDRHRQERNALREEQTRLSEKLHSLNLKQNTVKVSWKAVSERAESLQEDYRKLTAESREIEAQICEIQQNRSGIREELKESKDREQNLQAEAEKAAGELAGLREEEQALAGRAEQTRLRCSEVTQKCGFLDENLRGAREEAERLEREKRQLEESLAGEEKDSRKKEEDILEIRKTIEAAGQIIAGEEQETEEYLRQKEQLNQSHKAFFRKRDELQEHRAGMDKECFRLGAQLEKLEERRESQISYLWEEYETTPDQAPLFAREELRDWSSIRKSIAGIREEIKGLGSVNVNAVEEFKEVSQRHAFLSAQYEDLVKAADTLRGIVAELDQGMRRQFTEKFSQIQAEFDKVFKQLFGGGKGALELQEDEDILEAGIRIISQPPGKKLQNMMQLSGGEKALTAIALLFAIQNLKPSPFCLLDEIEAALDDSNVTRFARYLHKLTKNTQFIIITHRRGTMTAADRLYGITMQEKGVSTLVSVNLIENQLDK